MQISSTFLKWSSRLARKISFEEHMNISKFWGCLLKFGHWKEYINQKKFHCDDYMIQPNKGLCTCTPWWYGVSSVRNCYVLRGSSSSAVLQGRLVRSSWCKSASSTVQSYIWLVWSLRSIYLYYGLLEQLTIFIIRLKYFLFVSSLLPFRPFSFHFWLSWIMIERYWPLHLYSL